MKPGFIYKWADKATGLQYIGKHEGAIDDGYIGSGTAFKIEYNRRPDDFAREILWFRENISSGELAAQELKLLSEILPENLYNGSAPLYYNQVKNSVGYTSIDNPMRNPKLVEKMKATRKVKNLANVYENSIAKYGKEAYAKMNSVRLKGNTYASGNKGKPKSEEHKQNISKAIVALPKSKLSGAASGRKPVMSFEDTLKIYELYGITLGAQHLGIKRDAFYSRVILAKKKLTIAKQ